MGLLGDIGKAFTGALPNILTGGVSSLVSSLAGSALGGLNAQTSNHYTRELMRYQTDLQHAENKYWADYNSPLQQMDRLKAAGLNPNLVYGNGATATMDGTVSPSSHSDFRPASIDALGAANMLAQNQNLQAQNENLKQDARLKSIEADRKEWDLNVEKSKGGAGYQGWLWRKQTWQNFLNSVGTGERIHSETQLNDAKRDVEQVAFKLDNEFGFQIREEMFKNYSLENEYLEIRNKWEDKFKEVGLDVETRKGAEVVAHIAEINQLADYYSKLSQVAVEEKKNKTSQRALTNLQVVGQDIQNKINELERKYKDDTYQLRVIQEVLGPALNLVNSAAGVAGTVSKIKSPSKVINYNSYLNP